MATRKLTRHLKDEILSTTRQRLIDASKPAYVAKGQELVEVINDFAKRLLPPDYDRALNDLKKGGAQPIMTPLQGIVISGKDEDGNLNKSRLIAPSCSHKNDLSGGDTFDYMWTLSCFVNQNCYFETFANESKGDFPLHSHSVNLLNVDLGPGYMAVKKGGEYQAVVAMAKMLTSELEVIYNQYKDRMRLVSSLVNSSSSEAALLKKWPEAKGLIPEDASIDGSMLPMVIDPGLNEALRLTPVEPEAKAA